MDRYASSGHARGSTPLTTARPRAFDERAHLPFRPLTSSTRQASGCTVGPHTDLTPPYVVVRPYIIDTFDQRRGTPTPDGIPGPQLSLRSRMTGLLPTDVQHRQLLPAVHQALAG